MPPTTNEVIDPAVKQQIAHELSQVRVSWPDTVRFHFNLRIAEICYFTTPRGFRERIGNAIEETFSEHAIPPLW